MSEEDDEYNSPSPKILATLKCYPSDVLAAKDAEIARLTKQRDELAVESSKERRVLINEGTLKRNINPPPTTPRPAAPKAQVALSGSPSPDPAEAMRAQCEAIARGLAENSDLSNEERYIAQCILDRIAALKGKGDGK